MTAGAGGVLRVLVVDDEAMLRSALAVLLALEPDVEVVGEAVDGADAVAQAIHLAPDIVLMDLEMPRLDGVDAAQRISRQTSSRVVLMTRHARPGVLRRALSVGVGGFVPKTTPATRIVEVLRQVASGARYVDPDLAAVALTAPQCPLSARELDVLRLSRAGLDAAGIAAELHLSPGTVRNYASSAMQRLDVGSRREAAEVAWSNGWI